MPEVFGDGAARHRKTTTRHSGDSECRPIHGTRPSPTFSKG